MRVSFKTLLKAKLAGDPLTFMAEGKLMRPHGHTFLFQNVNFEKALFYFEKNHFEFRSKIYFEKMLFRQVT